MRHPSLKTDVLAPIDFEFHCTETEKAKLFSNWNWALILKKTIDALPSAYTGNTVIDAYAGIGISSLIYSDIGFQVSSIESNPALFRCLSSNMNSVHNQRQTHTQWGKNNLEVLRSFNRNNPHICMIDLDPYNHCEEQIVEAVRILSRGFLFVTDGSVYSGKRSGKWDFTKKYYGIDYGGPVEAYAQRVLFRFIRRQCISENKSAKLINSFTMGVSRVCVLIEPNSG